MNQRVLFFLFSFLMIFVAVGQESIALKGKVIDTETKEVLPFSYVTVEDEAIGTVTNGEGLFELIIPTSLKEKRIIFSYLGYKRKLIPVNKLLEIDSLVIELSMNAHQLKAVVIKPTKKISAKVLLRKVVAKIPDNYTTNPIYLEGYYRETIQENGRHIKFADAAVKYHYSPYQKKAFKWKDYFAKGGGAIRSLSNLSNSNGERLHRLHFHHRTTKDDQVFIVDSRSSENLTQTNMNANVEGGPLSLIGRDRLKFKESFLGKKKWKKFDYKLGEVNLKGIGWVYVLSFKTKITPEILESLSSKGNKRWSKANRNKLLAGKIYVDQKTFAVVKYECAVPNKLKKYFCGFKEMAIKHFDYKLNVEYEKVGDKYFLKYLRHEDEFIFKDTLKETTTPYVAVSEFRRTGLQLDSVKKFRLQDDFSNLDANQLFDFPLEYDSIFWTNYTQKHPITQIEDSIRVDMEIKKILEKQFTEKHLRDTTLKAPIAKKVPSELRIHGEVLIDDYAWLKDTKNPRRNNDIMEYLKAENEYADNYFIPLRKKQRNLFNELVSRVEKNTESLPTIKDGYEYTVRYTEDDEYPVYLRRKVGEEDQEEILNVNVLAKDKEYFSAGGINISPNTNIMAYYENTTGSDKSTLKFKDLSTGKLLNDSLTDAGGLVWINDSSFFYTQQEAKTNRTYQVKKHILFQHKSKDKLIFEEVDKRFSLSVSKSKSKKYLYINTGSSNANEVWFLPTETPNGTFKLIAPREKDHSYSIIHHDTTFYVMTNKFVKDFEVRIASPNAYDISSWKPFMRAEKGQLLGGFLVFDNYFVVGETEDMKSRLKIIDRRTNKHHYLEFKKELHLLSAGYNPVFDTDSLTFNYQSMKTPTRVYRYNMSTKEKRLVKSQKVLNYYQSRWIKQKRVWVEARDGVKIPVTLLYSPSAIWKDNKYKRMYLTSYGSYGSSSTAGFNHAIYSLVHRGFVYAIAHIRGGSELGEDWYDNGKMMNKKNTFNDFIDCAEYLIEEGYAQKGNIVAQGGSAGGLLMGAVVNDRPDLFKAVILDVPFVDVINTMLDDQLPLTTLEYEEWGNPNEKEAYDYIKSYSPYENVKKQDYPSLFFFTGINDSRVGYWEPAKMVAKLRQYKTDDNLLLLKTNLSAGHGGGSGRYSAYKDLSYKYTIIMDLFLEDFKAEMSEKEAAGKSK